MKEDKKYCMNSYLQFRCIADRSKTFKNGIIPWYPEQTPRKPIKDSNELEKHIEQFIQDNYDEKTAIMLSGGIDSMLLASYLPKGAKAYTLKCIADVPTTDETISAKKTADLLGLNHSIIEVHWEDYEKYTKELMKHKGAPIHSIEVQIYKAALQAKKDGYDKLLFGEAADCIYGGLDGLLSKDWTLKEFIERYNFVNPEKILKEASIIQEPFLDYYDGNIIDVHQFLSNFFYQESTGSYANACKLGNVTFLAPYATTYLDTELDLKKIRSGNSKYIIRDIFKKKFPDIVMNKKTPMPRPVDRWLKDWNGPKRKEFKENCIQNLNGDQKWMVYCLEQFLDQIAPEKDEV